VHSFLGHPWFVKDSYRGILCGVLTRPSIMDLLRVVRGQDVEEEIRCPCYLIASAKGHISSLYLLRHVGDRGQNYKTQVFARIVYSSITPDYVKGSRA